MATTDDKSSAGAVVARREIERTHRIVWRGEEPIAAIIQRLAVQPEIEMREAAGRAADRAWRTRLAAAEAERDEALADLARFDKSANPRTSEWWESLTQAEQINELSRARDAAYRRSVLAQEERDKAEAERDRLRGVAERMLASMAGKHGYSFWKTELRTALAASEPEEEK